ncbi:MAG: multidrug ABC transporter ATP-binding protein [Nitrosomonadales bacterium]|nr:MAG: multidrug ABC transporter ATP-binding protein [Nitrosomonadales bacterium]
MSETLPSLRARNLSRRHGRRMVLEALDLELYPGEVLGLLGPNGAGKSTTMRILTGNLAPGTGSVEICGVDLLENPVAAKMHLGYLPEIPPLYRELTVAEYLRLAARLHRVLESGVDAAVAQALQRCDLAGAAKRQIGNLSKGFQQRVGIAQAIVHSPAVIILDEPTAGLDPLQIREIRALIAELGRSHGVILSTHFLPEAEALCSRVLILRQGRAVFSGTIDGLRQRCPGGSLEDCFVHLTRAETA